MYYRVVFYYSNQVTNAFIQHPLILFKFNYKSIVYIQNAICFQDSFHQPLNNKTMHFCHADF